MRTSLPVRIFAFASLFATGLSVQAQIGIGTNTPAASSRLEVSAANRGFLPPRVNLKGTDDATQTPPTIASPATGLTVYNLATAGSGATAVSPGLYFYDGVKWQRVLNQAPDATIEFNTANPNTGSPTFTPNTPASRDVIYVSSVDASQWTYNGTAYVTFTPPASTAWFSQNSTTADAGSNKTGGIYRTGNVGIGTGSFTPTTKLDIRAATSGTGFRLVDGSQGANKVLQSDANGYASWATNTAITPAVIGTLGNGFASIGQNTYTGASIILPNGKWSVQVSMLVATASTGNYWVRTGFSSSSTVSNLGVDGIGPTLISGYILGGGSFQMLSGTVIINNTSGANKTYFYWSGETGLYDGGTANATFNHLGRNSVGENSIVAYPMN